MPHRCLLPAALTLLLSTAQIARADAGQPPYGPGDAKDVEAFAEDFFPAKMAERHVPGAVFVVVKDGRLVLAKGYGFADRDKKTPVVPDKTTFRVASVSKLFTATAVLQQVERGELDLHEDVNHYLKRFQVPVPFPRPVTLANLLTHTGGFDERTIGTDARTRAEQRPLGEYLAACMPACTLPPGDVISYSNHGVALAGYVVEETTGVPFARYVAENILTPLGMGHSSFEPDKALERALATGYDYDKDKDAYTPVTRTYLNAWPAGGLVATGTDMAAFMIAHLQDGQYQDVRILESATARRMHRQHFTQHPRLPGVAYGFFERFQNGRRTLEHSGDLSGFASLLCLIPSEGVGLFVSCNRDDFKLRDDLVRAYLDRYYPVRNSAPFPPAPADFAPRAHFFTGYYRYNRYSRSTIEKPFGAIQQLPVTGGGDGTLTIEIPSILRDVLQPIRLVEVEPLLFRRDDGDQYAAFRMDAEGRITHLALNVLGTSVVLEKVPWYESLPVQAALAIGFVAVFAAAVIVPLVGAALHRWRRRQGGARWTVRWPAFFVGFLNSAFIGGLAVVVAWGDLNFGVPSILVVLFALPLVSAAVTVYLLVCSCMAWRRRTSTFLGRVSASAFTVVSIGFLVFLYSWNLLGFNY
jgi:CubicO group peptidase (beta-lactamase class C family)